MLLHTWLAFVASSALLLAIPGPTALTMLRLSRGSRGRVLFALISAAVLGDVAAMALCDLGLGALAASSPTALKMFRYVAALYLVALGVHGLVALRREAATPAIRQPPARGSAFLEVFLVTAFNPKGIAFFAAFLPQFLRDGTDIFMQTTLLQGTFAVLSCIFATAWVLLGRSMPTDGRRAVRGRALRFAVSLLLLGVGLSGLPLGAA